MAKFFVGQRVRIKYSTTWPELNGQEGVIVDLGDGEAEVAPNCWGTSICPYPKEDTADWFGPYIHQLEPIMPEGHEPCGMSYEEMMQEFKEKVS